MQPASLVSIEKVAKSISLQLHDKQCGTDMQDSCSCRWPRTLWFGRRARLCCLPS